ncbi:MAG: hypothetical protein KC414_08235, partial [Romboutsia sp.]|nr:hypothetical protein [Romboutsia sp.]
MEKIKLNPISFNQNSIWPSVRHRSWNLEATILLLLGIACLYSYNILHELGVIGETIILVVFLSGLMGITRIEIPQTLPKYLYPVFSGFASMFMDSFLVLLMVSKLNIEGTEEEQLKFKAYNMIAALIGGVGTYFGEVYLLPLALQYQNGNQWYTMLPILPPILLFLGILSYLTHKNNVQITPTASGRSFTNGDIAEFVVFILLLFVLHNPILLLGLLLIY